MSDFAKQYGPLLALALTVLGWSLDHAKYHGRMEAHLEATDRRVDALEGQ